MVNAKNQPNVSGVWPRWTMKAAGAPDRKANSAENAEAPHPT